MNFDPIEIFKPGKHRSSAGDLIPFTEADLEASAKAYDPNISEAPIVIGHPKQDAPAYGWVQSMQFGEDKKLAALPIQVNEDFAEMVRGGSFKKVSASFYPPDHESNPVPGVYYLRHIGFLGAQAPAIKGLKQVEFNDSEEGIIEFGEVPSPWYFRNMASMFRRMRDYFIEAVGMEKADEIIPDYDIESMEHAAAELAADKNSNHFSEHTTLEGDEMSAEDKARLTALETENAGLKAENAELKTRNTEFAEREAEQQAKQTHDAIVEFVEAQIKEGRVLPKDKQSLIDFMESLDAEKTIEFSEEEGGKKVTATGMEYVKKFIEGLPNLVDFNERAASNGEDVDMNDATGLAKRAQEFQESEKQAGRTVSISAAVQHVTTQAKN